MSGSGYSRYSGGLVSGIALLTVGLVFLLDNLALVDASVIWPIIPIGIGCGFIIRHLVNRHR